MHLDTSEFPLFQMVQRFLPFKVTSNLKRIYFSLDKPAATVRLRAIYKHQPSELDLELLDDIVTNSDAHLPHHFVEYTHEVSAGYFEPMPNENILFSVHESSW